ncbi:hypothetical protein ILYODFUR_020137 [Ilyodon furcidens]|uniref:Uncharacterized protein n=1 Tax=Ilyodon furcidens TaxID=33524 RepID=A0ABV0UV36_9TELE
MFEERRLHKELHFLIGPIHMFSHLPEWPPPPAILHFMIDSILRPRGVSLDVVALWKVSLAATPMQSGTLRAGRRVSGGSWHSHTRDDGTSD